MPLQFPDHRSDPDAYARALGVSREAIDLYLGSEVVDLHIDTYLWVRILGYDLGRRHDPRLWAARFLGQVDLPRLREANVGAGVWVVTTNPFRRAGSRPARLRSNLEQLGNALGRYPEDVAVVRSVADFRAARTRGLHAAFLGVQGGNALGSPPNLDQACLEAIVLVTLVHLTNSELGHTSSPLGLGSQRGLTPVGVELTRALELNQVLVDVAHASPQTFAEVLAVHDRSRPVIASHTGVSGAYAHWRNLDDDQLRAIADSGGTVGIIMHGPYLGRGARGRSVEAVARHVMHAVNIIGARHVSLGSDWDGLIRTPKDAPTCLELPRLIQALLDQGLSETDLQWVLGKSFLETLSLVRP